MSEDSNVLPEDAVLLADESASLKSSSEYRKPSPIEIELPDGRKIVMAKPEASLADMIAGVLANVSYKDPVTMEMEKSRVKSLLYISSIDGVAEPKICNPIMRAALEQKIGDEFLDALYLQFMESFPSVDKSALKVVKKY